jgi:tetratricopeptide (TPR) repeat protein
MRSALALLAMGLAVVVTGCQRAPAPPRVAAPAAVDHLAAAKTALAVANWKDAAPHLRAALEKDPDNLFLHYNLAICATWLNRRDEAVHEFEWVLKHANSDSEEAVTARAWLSQTTNGDASAESTDGDPLVAPGAVRGVVLWRQDGFSPSPVSRAQLFLKGLHNTPTGKFYRRIRSDRDGTYEFKDVPPGSYSLSDAIGVGARWRLKVKIEPGQEIALDLTPDNGLPGRDDFPNGK